ncbi:hypothetical protein JQC67_08130 [Aurantibacter crassamenti]|uniref:hypothetical protein n=1 Tax=Aurantibacter crassamenti TaxID=1837375 RepID=UPI0019398D24|nr:hypothetical protein [Aurantibacter crassamenti]MBM1106099.1 hypothetical protein [Aurantibacter crassamenti]
MGKKLCYFLFGLLILVSLQSCVEELNFDQFDDLQIEPVLEGSILYVEAPESIINRAVAANFYTQDFNFDGFSDAFFADRVIDGVVTYLVENTTSKDLNITVEFIDDGGNVLDTEFFTITPAPPVEPVLREIPYGGTGRSLDILRNTSAIRVTAENVNGDTSSTSSLPDPKVTIKSSGKFTLSVK